MPKLAIDRENQFYPKKPIWPFSGCHYITDIVFSSLEKAIPEASEWEGATLLGTPVAQLND